MAYSESELDALREKIKQSTIPIGRITPTQMRAILCLTSGIWEVNDSVIAIVKALLLEGDKPHLPDLNKKDWSGIEL
jgi:hypothetical protein